MPDKDNVVEVDFRPNDELSPEGLREALLPVLDGLREMRKAAQRMDAQADRERARCRRLEAELLAERRRSFAFTDDAVFDALTRAYDGEPVFATAVAAELLDDPTQAAKIRTGLALARLAAEGRVEKLPPRGAYGPHRWMTKRKEA